MRLVKARVQGYRSVIDSGYFEIEPKKTILVGPNEAGKTAILQALQKLNPPEDVPLFDALRDYPRSKHDEDIKNGGIDPKTFTVVEGHFSLEEEDKLDIPNDYHNVTFVYGRYLNNEPWCRIDNGPTELKYESVEKDLIRIASHFDSNFVIENAGANVELYPSSKLQALVSALSVSNYLPVSKAKELSDWLNGNLKYVSEDNDTEDKRFEKLRNLLEAPEVRSKVVEIFKNKLPKFILFSNYFRIKPSLHLRNLASRVANKTLDDDQYDYGNLCLLKFLGFSPKELADAGDTAKFNNLSDPTQMEQYRKQLDLRDYTLNAATIRLTDAIVEVWNPKQDKRDASKLRIKADGQYLKVVVEDELGVEVELDQRSEGFQWLVSFFVVFFAEAADKHKNSILLLDEPGLSLHALKQTEFRETLSKLSEKNQTLYTTHSPFLIGNNELDIVRVVEMIDRKVGTKVNVSLTANDKGALLPLQEALGYDLAQSLFFHKKNLVVEGLTDYWYLEAISELIKETNGSGINDDIAMLPTNTASKVVYYATVLHAQNLKVAALLDSDSAGDTAATQDVLVHTLGNKKILRTKDVYSGEVNNVEIEDLLRDTLVKIAKEQLGWDVEQIAIKQTKRSIVDIFDDEIKSKFSKYKLAKAFLRWAREHSASDLTEVERENGVTLIDKINNALK